MLRTPLSLTARRDGILTEAIFVWIARFAVFAPLAMLVWLLAKVTITGLGRIDWEFVTSLASRRADRAGIWAALVGSLWLIVLTAAIALPVGVASAVYLEEYGRRNRFAGVIEVFIANLAGVPSIIYGMLGLGLFVRWAALGATVISAALTLALLVLPIVIMSTREALRTVKDPLREAALALGATRWRTTWHVVLPMALPGILTGAILAVSRAIGETAPLALLGAATYMTYAPDGLDSKFTALPIQIYDWTSQPKKAFLVNAAAAIVVLMVVLLVLNAGAIWLRNRYQRRS